MNKSIKNYCLGVDIGGTSVKIGLFSKEGDLIDNWSIPTNTECSGKYILPEIAESINEKINFKNISIEDIIGVGIGVPGPVDNNGIVKKCVNLGWPVTDVKTELETLLSTNVCVGNDANIAALGEIFKGGGKNFENLVMVTLGTGVGGGIILDGKILQGSDSAGGEIGHIKINPNETESCGCGNKGCLEQYASATGIVNITKRYLKENKDNNTISTTLKISDELSCEDIFNAAKDGDLVALQMVDTVCHLLGRTLAHIGCIVNPQVFVIGGGMASAGNILIDKIKSYYKEYAFHAAANTKFNFAELGNDAGIYGGAKLALDLYL